MEDYAKRTDHDNQIRSPCSHRRLRRSLVHKRFNEERFGTYQYSRNRYIGLSGNRFVTAAPMRRGVTLGRVAHPSRDGLRASFRLRVSKANIWSLTAALQFFHCLCQFCALSGGRRASLGGIAQRNVEMLRTPDDGTIFRVGSGGKFYPCRALKCDNRSSSHGYLIDFCHFC